MSSLPSLRAIPTLSEHLKTHPISHFWFRIGKASLLFIIAEGMPTPSHLSSLSFGATHTIYACNENVDFLKGRNLKGFSLVFGRNGFFSPECQTSWTLQTINVALGDDIPGFPRKQIDWTLSNVCKSAVRELIPSRAGLVSRLEFSFCNFERSYVCYDEVTLVAEWQGVKEVIVGTTEEKTSPEPENPVVIPSTLPVDSPASSPDTTQEKPLRSLKPPPRRRLPWKQNSTRSDTISGDDNMPPERGRKKRDAQEAKMQDVDGKTMRQRRKITEVEWIG
jgi:hypothetical protein